jgi:hypothetical protein
MGLATSRFSGRASAARVRSSTASRCSSAGVGAPTPAGTRCRSASAPWDNQSQAPATQLDGLRHKQSELDYLANETRQNLEAIKKDPAAASLRKKLNTRLEEFASESAKIARELSELQTQRLDKKIELEDKLRDIDLRAPGAAKKP